MAELSAVNPSKVMYPPTDGLEVVIGHFHEVGRVGYSGMGVTPLTWQEIDSWASTTSLQLPVWERLAIHEMSMAYVGEYNQASDPNREAPFSVAEMRITDREKVAKDLKAAFSAFKRT